MSYMYPFSRKFCQHDFSCFRKNKYMFPNSYVIRNTFTINSAITITNTTGINWWGNKNLAFGWPKTSFRGAERGVSGIPSREYTVIGHLPCQPGRSSAIVYTWLLPSITGMFARFHVWGKWQIDQAHDSHCDWQVRRGQEGRGKGVE